MIIYFYYNTSISPLIIFQLEETSFAAITLFSYIDLSKLLGKGTFSFLEIINYYFIQLYGNYRARSFFLSYFYLIN